MISVFSHTHRLNPTFAHKMWKQEKLDRARFNLFRPACAVCPICAVCAVRAGTVVVLPAAALILDAQLNIMFHMIYININIRYELNIMFHMIWSVRRVCSPGIYCHINMRYELNIMFYWIWLVWIPGICCRGSRCPMRRRNFSGTGRNLFPNSASVPFAWNWYQCMRRTWGLRYNWIPTLVCSPLTLSDFFPR